MNVVHVTNLTSNDTVGHSLVICKGSATCSSSTLIVKSQKILAVPVNAKGQFKCLLQLQPGPNEIRFFVDNVLVKSLLLFFERHSEFKVIPLYLVCSDGDDTFQAPKNEPNDVESARRRISTGCKLLQAVFSEKFREHHLERRMVGLDGCKVFYTKLKTEEVYRMDKMQLWYSLGREIMSSDVADAKAKYLGFLSCTRYEGGESTAHEDVINRTKGYVAYGGEALALVGSACLYTWPEEFEQIVTRFQDERPVDKQHFMDDSCFRGTLGSCFATTLGAALHELCHTFDLGHSELGIMARGFDRMQQFFLCVDENTNNNVNWTENCLMILYFNRWFSNSTKQGKIHYDKNIKLLKSLSGLRVVEVRRKSDEMVIRYWLFVSKVLKFSFQLADELGAWTDTIIFAIDNCGNTLKEDF